MEVHDDKEEGLATRLKAFVDSKTPFRIYHGDTMSTRLSTRRSDRVIDITRLNNIFDINPAARLATVEPNVSFEKLITATLKEGLMPLVVPSFPSITVRGAFVGTAVQSSSVTAGFFENSVAGVEVVLGNGSIAKAREEGKNSELFRDLVGSCGTLGVVTLLDVKLIKARNYVELEFIPVYSATEALETLGRYYKDQNANFVDALLCSNTVGVVMIGRLTNEMETSQSIVRFTRAKDNWFYLHAHSQIPHTDPCTTCPFSPPGSDDMDGRHARDFIPLKDYFFRFDRGNMWMGIYGQDQKSFGDKSRRMIDWVARTKNMNRAVHHSGRSQSFIVQDVTVPEEKGLELLSWAQQRVGIYPTWVCLISVPSRSPDPPVAASKNGMLLNINIWGLKSTSSRNDKDLIGHEAYKHFVEDNRMIEAKVRQVGGFKWPYAQHYHNSEEEFWNDYDASAVNHSRDKWHAGGMPTLGEKALVKTLLGMDHLLDQSTKKAKQ